MTGRSFVRACFLLATIAGCAKPSGTLFDPVFPPIVFPPPPDRARVAYVGELSTDRDLRPGTTGWQALKEFVAGAPPERSVSAPAGLWLTPDDRLFVTDPPQHCVHVFDFQARTYRTLSEAGGSPLVSPADVTIVDGRAYITDAGRGVIDVFSDRGDYQTSLMVGRLTRPVGITFERDLRRLYVVDAAVHAVIGISLEGVEQTRFGRRGGGEGELNFPTFIDAHPVTGIVVADSLNFRVQIFSPDGKPRRSFGRKGDAAGDFALPKGVAIDPAGRIWVADAHFENIQAFDDQGTLLMAFGREGRKPGEFWMPSKLAFDTRRRLWVADTYNRRIQVFRLLEEPPA